MHLAGRMWQAFVVILTMASSALAVAGEFDTQLRLAPESTNLVVLVNAQSVLQSSVAKDEGLKEKLQQEFTTGSTIIPPNATRFVMMAEVDPLDGMRPQWDLCVIDLNKAPDFLGFVKREKATLEHLNGHRMLQTHNGTLVLELRTQRMMASAMATRQMYARSLKGAESKGPARLSPYLTDATAKAPSEAQVFVALDLSQVFTPLIVNSMLGKRASPLVAEAIGSITGATCAVHFDKVRHVTIKLDFAEKPTALGDTPYETIQPILDALGLSEDKLQIARAEGFLEGKSIVLRGELPPDRLRELFRGLESSATSQDYLEPPPPENADPMELKAQASKRFLTSLESLLQELRETMRRDTIAELSERYARKIDHLPMLNVDEDLLGFAANVSSSLRYQAQQKREAGVRAGYRETIPTYTVYGRWGSGYNRFGAYGTYGAEFAKRDTPDIGGIAQQEQAVATQVRISEWKQIEDGLVKLRRTLTERYKIEF